MKNDTAMIASNQKNVLPKSIQKEILPLNVKKSIVVDEPIKKINLKRLEDWLAV